MLCYVMLCYVMLCYVMLCYVMLCYVMLCYVMLCYVMLCYVMLCYVMLCYVMLCYVMLCYVMLCYVMLCYVMLCYVMLCYVMLCYVMLCYVMLCYVMLCYVMLCYVMLCYVMLCYVMLCYVMLCYVMLCYVMLCSCSYFKKKACAIPATFTDRAMTFSRPCRCTSTRHMSLAECEHDLLLSVGHPGRVSVHSPGGASTCLSLKRLQTRDVSLKRGHNRQMTDKYAPCRLNKKCAGSPQRSNSAPSLGHVITLPRAGYNRYTHDRGVQGVNTAPVGVPSGPALVQEVGVGVSDINVTKSGVQCVNTLSPDINVTIVGIASAGHEGVQDIQEHVVRLHAAGVVGVPGGHTSSPHQMQRHPLLHK